MSDTVPDSLTAGPPPRDRRIVATAAVSVTLHLLLIAWLVVPRIALPEPSEPPAINVDLVPPEVVSSLPLVSSSEAPSSEELSSSAEAASSEAASSEQASSAPASSAEASSAAPSSAAGSSEPPDAGSSVASEAAASSAAPPVPMARPIVIPVGPSAESSEEVSSAVDTSASEDPSSAASEIASAEESSAASEVADTLALTTTDSGAADAIDQASSAEAASAIPPSLIGALHAAKRHYLEAMLNAPAMAKAKEAIKKLPPEKRLAQTCNIEAVGQIGNAGKNYEPDALVANAFSAPVIDGTHFAVSGGAFRSAQKWYGIAYDCTLSDDMTAIKAFSFRLGADVTAALKAKVGE